MAKAKKLVGVQKRLSKWERERQEAIRRQDAIDKAIAKAEAVLGKRGLLTQISLTVEGYYMAHLWGKDGHAIATLRLTPKPDGEFSVSLQPIAWMLTELAEAGIKIYERKKPTRHALTTRQLENVGPDIIKLRA
jgi:hypothetical protein